MCRAKRKLSNHGYNYLAWHIHRVSKRLFFMKQTWSDVYFGKFKWYRKMRKGTWYKHQFTKDAEELTFPQGGTWWARYGKINRYSDVVATEVF